MINQLSKNTRNQSVYIDDCSVKQNLLSIRKICQSIFMGALYLSGSAFCKAEKDLRIQPFEKSPFLYLSNHDSILTNNLGTSHNEYKELLWNDFEFKSPNLAKIQYFIEQRPSLSIDLEGKPLWYRILTSLIQLKKPQHTKEVLELLFSSINLDTNNLLDLFIKEKEYEVISWLVLEKNTTLTEENITSLNRNIYENKYFDLNIELLNILVGHHEKPFTQANLESLITVLGSYNKKNSNHASMLLGIEPISDRTILNEENALYILYTLESSFRRFSEYNSDTMQITRNRLEYFKSLLQKNSYNEKIIFFIQDHLDRLENSIHACINTYNQMVQIKTINGKSKELCNTNIPGFEYLIINTLVEKKSFPMMLYFLRVLTPSIQKNYPLNESYRQALLITMDKEVHLNSAWGNEDILNQGAGDIDIYLAKAIASTLSEIKTHSSLPHEEIQFLTTLLSELEEHLVQLHFSNQLNLLDPNSIKQFEWDQCPSLIFQTGFTRHAMIQSFERDGEETVSMTVINTGGGLDNHPQWKDSRKYLTYLSLNKIPFEDVFNLKDDKIIHNYISENDFYNDFKKKTEKGLFLDPPSDEQYYQTIQADGTCTGQSIAAWMRHFIMKNYSSKWEALGRYKYVKALVRSHLLINSLEYMPKKFTSYVEQKIEKYQQERLLFETYAQSEFFYNQVIEACNPVLESTLQEEAKSAQNSYERFSVLLVIINQIADKEQENISLDGLELISKMINTRVKKNRETIEKMIERLNSFSSKEKALDIALNLYNTFPFLLTDLRKWKKTRFNEVSDST